MLPKESSIVSTKLISKLGFKIDTAFVFGHRELVAEPEFKLMPCQSQSQSINYCILRLHDITF